ncbi:MAG TPA: RNA polymerase sigma factor [Actinomycetota bacterium]|nr:RNA polymerase sigma factor [Actinomycetota bacterium]
MLVLRYQDLAHRTAYVITGSAAEADDAAQEAFVKAYYALDRFRSESPFRPWLLRIVANEARNRLRSAGRRRDLAVRAGRERPSGGAAPSPEVVALAGEERERVLAALNRLKERDRTVVAMRFLLELDETEMAAVLDCARGTVKSRLSRAMTRLKRELNAMEPEAAPDRGEVP